MAKVYECSLQSPDIQVHEYRSVKKSYMRGILRGRVEMTQEGETNSQIITNNLTNCNSNYWHLERKIDRGRCMFFPIFESICNVT